MKYELLSLHTEVRAILMHEQKQFTLPLAPCPKQNKERKIIYIEVIDIALYQTLLVNS